MRLSHRATMLLLALGMFLTVCPRAEAYIDAGSGSYLLQILCAAIFGGAFALKSSFATLKMMLMGKWAKVEPTDNESA